VPKLAGSVKRGDRVIIDGNWHVAIVDAAHTYGGVTVCSVPDKDRDAEESYTGFGHNDDVETWGP
jgi:hypothetical protein